MSKKIIFNIGRQFGSGGKSIANGIGERLGIHVYDSEIIAKASEKSGLSSECFSESDEKKRNLRISSLFGSSRAIANQDIFYGTGFNDAEIFRVQSEAIRDIAAEGSAVFVGRASDYVLRDLDCCVDVFVAAPPEVRAATVSKRLGIGVGEAMSMLEKKDSTRKEYYNFYTFGHWGMASNYDICVDSSILGIDGTVELILDFARRRGLI